MVISIHPISMGIDTVYALRGKSVIMIDGGTFSNVGKFKEGIEKAAIRPEEIQLIVLTHGHWDHIGSAKAIKELTGARVLLHQDDLKFLIESNPPQPPGLTAWGKIGTILLNIYSPFSRIQEFEVDKILSDDEFSLVEYGIPGKVIHTPGVRLVCCSTMGRHLFEIRR